MLIKLGFKLISQSINATTTIKELIYLCKNYEPFVFLCAHRPIISVSFFVDFILFLTYDLIFTVHIFIHCFQN